MSRETIVGELAGRPTFTTSKTDPDHLRACLIVEGHATLPEVLTVELRGRNAVVGPRPGSPTPRAALVTAELWTRPGHDQADGPPDRLSPASSCPRPCTLAQPPDLARGSTTHDRTQRPEGGSTP